MPTDARATLQEALQQALVVEHELGLQYLYAAASLQWIPPEDLEPDDPRQVDYCSGKIIAIHCFIAPRQVRSFIDQAARRSAGEG